MQTTCLWWDRFKQPIPAFYLGHADESSSSAEQKCLSLSPITARCVAVPHMGE